MHKLVLKKGKERAILNRHHWIFSGALASLPKNGAGEILPVYSSEGTLLGHAMYNPKVSMAGRMVSFGNNDPIKTLRENIRQAISFRASLFNPSITNAYRVINGEGDQLPGLIVDKYDHTLVVQILSLGMDKQRAIVLEELHKGLKPTAIYEKSTKGSRSEEGLSSAEGYIFGPSCDEIPILENGLKFIASPVKGQKTGFFLDQREMRQKIGSLSQNKKVLNCFSYTGAFSIYALAAGASSVVSVETSAQALQGCTKQIALNQLDESRHQGIQADVFQYLKDSPLDFDIIILDPPAFAKRKGDLPNAAKGYVELNRAAIHKARPGSMLLTCSCSPHISQELFQNLIFQAASPTGRQVRIIGRHLLAPDHPINLYHPETEYLKSLLLSIV